MAEFRVHNAGIGGHTTKNLLARLDRDVLALKPKLVVLMGGTNDALNSKSLVPIGETRHNFQEIAARVTMQSSLLWLNCLPFYEPYLFARHDKAAFDAPPQARLDAVNLAARELAAASKIPFVNSNAVFTALGRIGEEKESWIRNEANSNTKDGVHPTAEGYRALATAVFSAIGAANLPRERIVCFGDSITMGAQMQGAGTIEGETYPAFLKKLLES